MMRLFLGVIASIFVIIGGIFTVKNNIFPSGPKLETIVSHYNFFISDELLENADNFENIDLTWNFEITNIGNALAKGIQLSMPNGKLYSLDQGKTIIQKFDKNIELGELQPTAELSVIVWSGYSSSEYQEKDIKVIYDNGISKMKYSDEVATGIWSKIIKFLKTYWFNIVIGLCNSLHFG